jgi:hypothetical protein
VHRSTFTGSLVTCFFAAVAGRMQARRDWLPARASEPGCPLANGAAQHGSRKTNLVFVSWEPGSCGRER